MLTLKYHNNSYSVDTTTLDSDYLKSLIECGDDVVELTLFEDIISLISSDREDDLFQMDREYLFKGLSYFCCNKLMERVFKVVKDEVYKKERRIIQQSIESFFEEYIYGID